MTAEQKQEKQKAPETSEDIQRQLLESALEANRLKRLELGVAADEPNAKLLAADKLAHEETLALGEQRGPEQRIVLSVRLTSPDVGPLTIGVVAVAFKDTSDEPRRGERGSPRGKLRVFGLRDWYTGEASEVIRSHHMDAHRSSLEELQREGLKDELAKLEQNISRNQVRAAIWQQITLPSHRLLVGKLIDDLVAAGGVSIVDAVEAAQ